LSVTDELEQKNGFSNEVTNLCRINSGSKLAKVCRHDFLLLKELGIL
jgi:hypothetical protein